MRAGAGWYSHTGSIECSVLNCAYTYECVGLGVCVSVLSEQACPPMKKNFSPGGGPPTVGQSLGLQDAGRRLEPGEREFTARAGLERDLTVASVCGAEGAGRCCAR